MIKKTLGLTLVFLLLLTMGVLAEGEVELEEEVEEEIYEFEEKNQDNEENDFEAKESNEQIQAEGGSILDHSNIEVYTGLNYNTYSDLKVINYSYDVPDDETNNGDQLAGYDKGYIEKKNSSIGFYGGFRYWITERIGVGTEIEHMGATWDLFQQKHVKIDTTGFLGTLNYRVADDLMVNFAGGGYAINAEFPKFNAFGENLAYGIKASLEGGIPVYDNLSLNGRVGYRYLFSHEIEDFEYGRSSFEDETPYEIETDFSGFEFAVTANLSF
ncbi:hypothetical protein [Natroniella sp. ANB-PHB2]|uniref:hypothetical protein n=1 Tax=Natroniella sp. ANB-PHB2 TaxID=3384444 RepID=UPI0038D3C528